MPTSALDVVDPDDPGHQLGPLRERPLVAPLPRRAFTRGGTVPAVSPKAISLVQVQRHGLLSHRRPQPLNLRTSFLQLELLGGLARPRRRQGVQRALLGRPADRDDRRAIQTPLLRRDQPLTRLATRLRLGTPNLLNG